MIIFLSELQKEHLQLLHQHSALVLADFCKLAIEYLNNGLNNNKLQNIADKFKVCASDIQNLVHAIVFLILEGYKYSLSEADFKSSLAIAGFSTEQQDVLVKLYNSKKDELSECLHLLQQKDPIYQDLYWRLEAQVASRHCNEELNPTVALDLILTTPKKFGQQDNSIAITSDTKNASKISKLKIDATIQEAKAASHCHNIVEHIYLQCDIPNLIHMTEKLDQALKESKSQHVRKVKSALQ